MPRYRLAIEYDGSAYNGFQAQAGQPTVQGAIEGAIKAFCGAGGGGDAEGACDSDGEPAGLTCSQHGVVIPKFAQRISRIVRRHPPEASGSCGAADRDTARCD